MAALFHAGACFGDASSDLAQAEAERSAAQSEAASGEAQVRKAEQSLSSVASKAEAADAALRNAEARLDRVEEELVNERQAAAKQIALEEGSYEDEKESQETTAGLGIMLAFLAVVVGAGAFGYSKFRKWPLSKTATQIGGAALGLVFIGGVTLAVAAPAPESPEFSRQTLELAADAKGDPADPATPPLREAELVVARLTKKSEPLDAARKEAEGKVTRAESDTEDAEARLTSVERDMRSAEKEIAHIEEIAEEETLFREEATTIDYGQLIKNPDAYRGEKAVYTGQVLQIQEYGGGGFMLLSVTDEGYGFWTDNIWIDFDEPTEAAEEDIITVYGKMTGAEEYETQIGGGTYVPKMRAKYIDE